MPFKKNGLMVIFTGLTKVKNKGFLQRTAERIIREVAKKQYTHDPNAYILDENESMELKKLHLSTIVLTGVLGGLGVVILFGTRYAFPAFFPRTQIKIPIIEYSFTYNIVFMLYGVLLAYIELFIVYYMNLVAIKKMVIICNYPHPSDPEFYEEVAYLAEVGLERTGKHGKDIGMNPYQGVPKVALTFYLLLNFYKAALSNVIIRLLVTRIGGRTLGKVFIDMLGVPVFVFWNIFASRKILKEARIRIFSRPLTEKFVKQLYHEFHNNQEFIPFIYDTLQYISMIKRNYNYSHYNFANLLLTTFGIPPVKKHELPKNYFERLQQAPVPVQRGIEKLIVFGMVIDGKISASENIMIKKAIDYGIILSSKEELEELCINYYRGKGLPTLVSII